MKYGNRSPWHKIILSPIAIVLGILILVFLSRAAWNARERAKLSETRLAQAEAALARLEAEREDLSDRVRFLSTEEGVEAEIRGKYRAVRAGESVAVLVDDRDPGVAASTTPPVSGWKKFLRIFGL